MEPLEPPVSVEPRFSSVSERGMMFNCRLLAVWIWVGERDCFSALVWLFSPSNPFCIQKPARLGAGRLFLFNLFFEAIVKRKITQFQSKSGIVGVNRQAICSIDHECVGCAGVTKSCCAKYDVCVSDAELNRIIPVLPDAAQYCPHLKID